jgi:hypothetical protein
MFVCGGYTLLLPCEEECAVAAESTLTIMLNKASVLFA